MKYRDHRGQERIFLRLEDKRNLNQLVQSMPNTVIARSLEIKNDPVSVLENTVIGSHQYSGYSHLLHN